MNPENETILRKIAHAWKVLQGRVAKTELKIPSKCFAYGYAAGYEAGRRDANREMLKEFANMVHGVE